MGGPRASVLLCQPLTEQQENELDVWLRSITHHLEKNKRAYEFWLNEDAFPGTVSRCLFYLSVRSVAEEQFWDNDEARQIKEQLGYLPEQYIGISSGCNEEVDHTTLGQFVLHLASVYNGLISMDGAITPPLLPLSQEAQEKIRALLATAPERGQERRAYTKARLDELKASLPPGKTMQDLFQEQHADPDSPLKRLEVDIAAKFGPVLPLEASTAARMPSLEETSVYVTSMPGQIYAIEYTTAGGRSAVWHIVDREFLQAWMEHPDFYMIK